MRPGDTAVLDVDAASGRTVVLTREHANNIVPSDIVFSSVEPAPAASSAANVLA